MTFDVSADDLTIGVIGAGAMGQGIVQVSLQGGMNVVLFDANPKGATVGKDLVVQRLRRAVERGRLEASSVEEMIPKLNVSNDLSDFSNCKVVVEAVFEDLDVKHAVYKKLEEHVTADCIIASNTSSLPISSLGRPCKHHRSWQIASMGAARHAPS